LLYELTKSEYEIVRHMFEDLKYQLTTSAVLDGTSPGRVFIDDTSSPTAAFMHTVEGFFLAGSPESENFREGLKEHAEEIITRRETMRPAEEDLFFGFTPDSWVDKFDSIFKMRPPLDCPRRHYVCNKIKLDWRAKIPTGYEVRRVDLNLLKKLEFSIPQHMTEWIELNWGANEKFIQHGFGFCTVHENQVVSWSIADSVSGNLCEIGIHTKSEFRRKGLATITAAAAVEYALSAGYSQVGWHTDQHNYGSIGIAEKIGFVKERDYTQYVCIFDEAIHIAETGMRLFLDQHYLEAIDLFNKASQLGKIPGWAYYLKARSHALLGNYHKAIECMKLSAINGYANVEHILNCEDLECLHGYPEWVEIISLIKQNLQK
jgi:RimJ/RimL family protein N-acetyltransferase